MLPALLLALLPQTDPAKDLASNDASVRLAAIQKIAEQGHPDAEKLCLKALGDEDWEVATIAAHMLGELGAKKAFGPLLEEAVTAPVRGLRRAASEALARIDAPQAYDKLVKKLAGDDVVRAAEAITSLGPALESKASELKTKELEKLLEDRQNGPRRAAARALLALAGAERPARLKEFLKSEDRALRAVVIEAAGESGDPALFPLLVGQYEGSALPDYLVRRIHVAVRQLFLAHPEKQEEFLTILAGVRNNLAAKVHVARLVGLLAEEHQGKRALDQATAYKTLQPLLIATQADVRAAAVAACARIGDKMALIAAGDRAGADGDPRVRRIGLEVVARALGAKDEGTRALLRARLNNDSDPAVRVVAATALGVRGAPDIVPALEVALDDADWRVMTVAAVSLGKTEHEESATALMNLFQKGADDWRKRASAVAGLTRLRARSAVPVLIACLEDKEALVARTAYEFLCEISHERLEPKPALWSKWWEANGERVKLSIPEEVVERRKKLEYVRTPEELFAGTYVGIDVMVLQSIGDHIENVLADLGIDHRRTHSGQVLADGLQPQGVFVSNCTGEITQDEADRLAWFVYSGGALFGSCWALHETIEKLDSGYMRKLETNGQVLADVAAYPVDPDSRFLQGVFATDARPIYHLEGAHLIEVLDPEEVEVLVDSPQCGEAFGGANLAAWFRLGHGMVLDSANHFEGQGFQSANNVREPVERMAYAIDHMGMTYAKLRELRKEKFWAKTSAAAEKVKDLSVFRLITNFVWLKRLAEE